MGLRFERVIMPEEPEELAAAKSCEAAKRGLKLLPWATKQSWCDGIPKDCREFLEEARDLQCKHADSKAKLTDCPFNQDGTIK